MTWMTKFRDWLHTDRAWQPTGYRQTQAGASDYHGRLVASKRRSEARAEARQRVESGERAAVVPLRRGA